MSSHHYVKEGQEPALVIANGQECSYSLLTSFLEWSPYIVVLDGAYTRVRELKVTPDLVIGDFDSIGDYEPMLHVQYIQDKNQENTDLEKAINHLVEKGYVDITVVWATGKRLDHTVNNLATLAKYPKCNIVMYDDYSKAHILPKIFSKKYKPGASISLVPLPQCSKIVTQNLKYALDSDNLIFGQKSGTSNQVVGDGLVQIKYDEGVLALIEGLD